MAEEKSLVALVVELLQAIVGYIRQEAAAALNLLLVDAPAKAKHCLIRIALGTVLVMVGAAIILVGAVLALRQVLPLWGAMLVVGGVALLAGAVLFMVGGGKGGR